MDSVMGAVGLLKTKKHSDVKLSESRVRTSDGSGDVETAKGAYRPLVSQSAYPGNGTMEVAPLDDKKRHRFLDCMSEDAYSSLNAFAFLATWAGNVDAIRKAVAKPADAMYATSWLCDRMNQAPSDTNTRWEKPWKVLCDQIRVTFSVIPTQKERKGSADAVKDLRFWYIRLVDAAIKYEFMQVANKLPGSIGWPLLQALRAGADALNLDLSAQLVARPSEGAILLWFGALWEMKTNVFSSKIKLPSQDHMVQELLRMRVVSDAAACETATPDVSYLGTGRRSFSKAALSSPRSERAVVQDQSPRTPRATLVQSTRSDLEEILWGLDAKNTREQIDGHVEACSSVLEALCHTFGMMQPRSARLARMRGILGLLLGSHGQGLTRLVVSTQVFLAFKNEEEALTFFIYMIQRLDVQQAVAHFTALQDQSQRCIRLHSNPLFACLRITAAVCNLCKHGGMMKDTWAEEHGRLKKVAVQIFEMLPPGAFDKIFENIGIQQMFLELAIHRAECLEMLDIARFKDYLQTRWNGMLQLPEEVKDVNDYHAYWNSSIDPNVLIFSPKVRFVFRAMSFVCFTVLCQSLPEEFVTECSIQPSVSHLALWVCVFGHVLVEALEINRNGLAYFSNPWKLLRASLLILYMCLFGHCLPWTPSMDPETIKTIWGITVGLMTLRWLQFLTCVGRFGSLVKTIGLMTLDISNFLLVFSLFLLSWAMFFTRMRPEDPSYNSLLKSLFTLFRAALGDFQLDELILESETDSMVWFQAVALVAFLLVAAILLLNLLISIMSTTYDRVHAKGDAESAKAFLETMSEGENHEFLELDALPPPLNFIYGCFIPLFLVGAWMYVWCTERGDGITYEHRVNKYNRLKEHQAPPTLLKFVLLPITLPLTAIVTIPSFAVLLVISPLIPSEPEILNVFFRDITEDVIGNASWLYIAAKCHLLLPAVRFQEAYRHYAGDRMTESSRCVYFLIIPWLSLGCAFMAILIFVLGMPCYWIYESLLRGISTCAETHERFQLPSCRPFLPKSNTPSSDSWPHAWLGEYCLHEGALQLVQKGSFVLDTESEETRRDVSRLCGEEIEIEHSAKQRGTRDLREGASEIRVNLHTYFMRDVKTLDVGMLWCAVRTGRLPDVSASQLERAFVSSQGHEGRTERMLEKHTEMLARALAKMK